MCTREENIITTRIEILRKKLNHMGEKKDFSLNDSEMYSLSTQLDQLIYEYTDLELDKRRNIQFFTETE
ncbi:aspartyl-phosphate phosphatase Spo0E family protein [Candidatus Contubernalis alkaliaceticus]|uniref:aspartyl-phosphate phosphatase Spo0E family protein n=1 Tax=Candidatus Contubernalis alkaliaceticus TaxID=338645 RepID=UPI001F4BD236|nr:aspartyl-phosphate phosphatase Spo0E family protein [Candidatus Contubernalis alkalaceticus]UNC92963.1 aspartyl-phosphate phosphatase Spo0E family protein [Candidatus Contubernalis alkalaceticus]